MVHRTWRKEVKKLRRKRIRQLKAKNNEVILEQGNCLYYVVLVIQLIFKIFEGVQSSAPNRKTLIY